MAVTLLGLPVPLSVTVVGLMELAAEVTTVGGIVVKIPSAEYPVPALLVA